MLTDIVEIDGIKLDLENRLFFQAAEHVKNSSQNIIYLTGKAGTGKTTFLKYIRETYPGNVVVLAPTGVAAVNAYGQTIHSFFRLEFTPYPPGDQRLQVPQIYQRMSYRSEKIELIKNLSLLIIDEVSMVRCDILDAIDTILRVYRKNQEPFGGVKVLLIGDLFQLPPIAQSSDWTVLGQYYKSPYFFDSSVYKRASSTYIELEKPYRQTEQEFIDILNKVRVNQMSDSDLRRLNARYSKSFPKGSIFLTARNFEVENYNSKEYNELQGQEYTFNAQTVGTFSDSMKPVKDQISLKVGTQVMIMKNRYNKQLDEFDYYNGSIGTVTQIGNDCRWVSIKLDKGLVTVYPATWENIEFTWNPKTKESETRILGTYTQIPLKLAWAITIHKSQGLTFDKVTADLNSCFDTGQVYVALSRCKKLGGLFLKSPLLKGVIKVDQNVVNFSQQKTPDTMIIEQIEAGKADKIYKECRKAFDDNDAEKMIADYKEAVKIRDDFDTPKFNKYVKVKLALFHHYKAQCKALLDILAAKDKSIQEKEKELSEAKEIINTSNDSLVSANQKIVELQKDNDAQKIAIQNIQTTCENLKMELSYAKKETDNQKEKLEMTESFLKGQLDTVKKELASSKGKLLASKKNIATLNKSKIELEEQLFATKDKLNTANNEIIRLRNLKWYQKLFGKE